jgi:seryl-tRNA synthetase
MIDLGLLRADPKRISALITKKEPTFDVDRLILLDVQVRKIRLDVETLRHKKNELAEQGKSGISQELREQSIEVGKTLKQKEADLVTIEKEFHELYLNCPNLLHEDVPVGGKESNVAVRTFGEKPKFDFEPKHHLELGTALGWLDFDAATTMAGSNFALYRGDAAKMLYALTALMLKNNIKNGFELIIPPYLVNERSLEISSNFPKFRDQVYAVPEDQLYLCPTSEVNLTNLYREKILMADQLPIRMTSWTNCFRREAGGYGATERGLIRIHQFEKVELYTICEPENSMQELESMVAIAENILKMLGLHYRVSLLAAQDCSFASTKTYDIEVWLPGQKAYYEVSSCSNCTDFQARRGLIRYKKSVDGKAELTHTLNASSLALPRLMVAIMETYQQADGSIDLPDILKKDPLFTV